MSIPFAGHAEAPSTAHETGNIATHADLPSETANHAMSHPSPEWAEKLKGQTIVEDAMEGHAERTSMVDRQHQRVMEQMAKDADVQRTSGYFNNMNMMHQYGAGSQDVLLMSQTGEEPVSTQGGQCPAGTPVRRYDVSAINVEITLNRWLDFYPGYMYVLTENIEKVREEETHNREAREQGRLRSRRGHQRSAEAIGSSRWCFAATRAIASRSTLQKQVGGRRRRQPAYPRLQHDHQRDRQTRHRRRIPMRSWRKERAWNWNGTFHRRMQEGGRQFHSYSNDRELTVMGLFGTFVVEPQGSEYLDPLGTGEPTAMTSGWQAIIKNGAGPDFREFVIFYHEVGDEAFRPVNKKGDFLPQRDPLTDIYRPVARALNYRSEPFGIDNMHMQHEYFGFEDESMAYSAYTFGDLPTTIPAQLSWAIPRSSAWCTAARKCSIRIIRTAAPSAGRAARAPCDEMPLWHAAKNGPVKYPVIRTKSDRVDVEVIGPSETLDLETECGSGLCQQLAGDFLFHCHVAHHYVSGMWGYWRVYNTMQEGDSHTDVMPDLRELPDRAGPHESRRDLGPTRRQDLGLVRQTFTIVEKGKTNWKAIRPS